jgi:hypothetical protein
MDSNASRILGIDFISPEEFNDSGFHFPFNSTGLTRRQNTIPPEDVLERYKSNGYVLVPGPYKPMNIRQVCGMRREYFSAGIGAWYRNRKEIFSLEETLLVNWVAIRKDPILSSIGATFQKQKDLLREQEVLPSAVLVSWVTVLYQAIRGLKLFENVHVRTSSKSSDGRQVRIGRSDDQLLEISRVKPGGHPYTGISTALLL